jgi:hypothetical protein
LAQKHSGRDTDATVQDADDRIVDTTRALGQRDPLFPGFAHFRAENSIVFPGEASMKVRLVATVGLAAFAACLAFVPADAVAQSAAPSSSRSLTGLGYGFGGIGAASGSGSSQATLHFGGGFEVLGWDAVGVGAELGYLAPFDGIGDGIGMLSLNGTYHLFSGERTRKARPFITGGYSLAFRNGHENLFNLGGGVDYWVKPKVGLRIEFRDHIWTGGEAVHFWGARVGVVLR